MIFILDSSWSSVEVLVQVLISSSSEMLAVQVWQGSSRRSCALASIKQMSINLEEKQRVLMAFLFTTAVTNAIGNRKRIN